MAGLNMINIIFRVLQLLFVIILLALVGNMEAILSGPSIVNYCMFTAVWSAFTLLYLVPAAFIESMAFHWAIPVSLDILNVIFTFVAAVALPSYIHVHSCNNYVSLSDLVLNLANSRQDYVFYNSVTAGSEQRCREAQASTAFFWFLWASFMVSCILTGLQGRNGGVSRVSGPRRGPVMSQV